VLLTAAMTDSSMTCSPITTSTMRSAAPGADAVRVNPAARQRANFWYFSRCGMIESTPRRRFLSSS
jgi:hypothetical protein